MPNQIQEDAFWFYWSKFSRQNRGKVQLGEIMDEYRLVFHQQLCVHWWISLSCRPETCFCMVKEGNSYDRKSAQNKSKNHHYHQYHFSIRSCPSFCEFAQNIALLKEKLQVAAKLLPQEKVEWPLVIILTLLWAFWIWWTSTKSSNVITRWWTMLLYTNMKALLFSGKVIIKIAIQIQKNTEL